MGTDFEQKELLMERLEKESEEAFSGVEVCGERLKEGTEGEGGWREG